MSRYRTRCRRVRSPGLEVLEGRRLLAQFGVPWHQADHLTFSFVPDGTSVAGVPSGLFRMLDGQQPAADWQREILQAFQTWAVEADINFALVPDGGQPLGTPGPDQGDPRFGDIRIAAEPMSPGVLAVSVPHDPFLSGTWSGDIILNDAAPSVGQADTLFPVLLHEIGHVLGLDHSDDPASVMFPQLNSRTALAPSDIAAVQALYGPRPEDPYEGPAWNNTPQTATPMPEPTGYDGTTPLLFYANLSSNADVDFYMLTVPDGYSGPLTLRLQTAGVSLLEPRLTVLDAAGQIVSDLASTTPGGDTLQAQLPEARAGETYTVEVRGATNDIFGIGEYVMAATFDARSTVGPDAIDRLARQSYDYLSADDIRAILVDPVGALFHVDAHTNDTFATAEDVAPAGAYGSEAPDRIIASLSDPTDVDVYHIETPDEDPGYGGTPGSPLTMTVTVRATQVNGIMPTAAVFDANENPVPALVLAHGDGTFTIQVTDVQADSDYFVRVGADPTSGKVVGNYDLDVEYGHTDAAPASFLDASLNGAGQPQVYSLVVDQTQLFDLLLAATAPAAPQGAAVEMSLTDGQGRVVAERMATAGQTAGGDPVLLPPGVYQAVIVIVAAGGASTTTMSFHLYGASLTDPIGPALDDTTLRPLAIAVVGNGSAASLPVLGSNEAPYYWLALSLGSRGVGVLSLEEGQSFGTTAVGPLPSPIAALATVDVPDPSRRSASRDEITVIVPTATFGGNPSLTARVSPGSSLELVANGHPVVSGILVGASPAGPGDEPPRNPGAATGDGSSVTLADAPALARTPTSPLSAAASHRPPVREAPSDRRPVPSSSPAWRQEVGPDLAQAIAVLGTAALVYSRLHSGRAGDPIGLPISPVRAFRPLLWSPVRYPSRVCRV